MVESVDPGRIDELRDSVAGEIARLEALRTTYRELVFDVARSGEDVDERLQPVDEVWRQLGDVATSEIVSPEQLRAQTCPFYDKIVDGSQIRPNVPVENPITLEIVSDFEVIIHGRQVQITDHLLYLFNGLLRSRDPLTQRQLTGYDYKGLKHSTSFRERIRILDRLLNGGRRKVFMGIYGQNAYHYSLADEVQVIDRRDPEISRVENSEEPVSDDREEQVEPEIQPEAAEASATDEQNPADTIASRLYESVMAKARSLSGRRDAASNQDDLERWIARELPADLKIVSDVLLIGRITELFAEPAPGSEELPTLAGVAQYRKALCDRIGKALKTATDSTDEKYQLTRSELILIGLRLGLPSSIPILAAITIPSSGGPPITYYDLNRAAAKSRRDPPSLNRLLFKTSLDTLQQSYDEAIAKLKRADRLSRKGADLASSG